MRVIYLAGMSHSGSTLLSLMLNAHPDVIAVGELIDLPRRANWLANRAELSPCPCGAPSLHDCDFWSRVGAQALKAERVSPNDPDLLNDRTVDQPSASDVSVLRAISAVSGKKFIVDSSKRPGRLSHLLKLKDLDVFPIHLVRDPRGQVSSLKRKHGGFLRHIFSYARIHGRLRRIVKSVPHRVVHYEDLARDPEGTLSAILEPLGLRFDRRQLQWFEQTHHTLGGNKLRWQPSGLVLDERWKQTLTPLQQMLVGLGTTYSRRGMRGDLTPQARS